MEKLIIKYLQGEATQEETRKIKEWAKSNKDNQKYLIQYETIWNELGKIPEETFENEHIWKNIKSKLSISQVNSRSANISWFYKVAVAVILLAAISVPVFMSSDHETGNEIVTITKSEQRVNLPDGSVVWLRNSSRLNYPKFFTHNKREVELEGEAFFEVHKDASSPFQIITKNATVTVLGTSFNLSSPANGSTVVAVKTGLVSLAAGHQKIEINQNEQGTYNSETKQIKKEKNIDPNAFSWHTRNIVFNDSDMEYVCRTLGKVYNKQFVMQDPALIKLKLTTAFNDESFENVLLIIEKTLDVHISVLNDKVLINK